MDINIDNITNNTSNPIIQDIKKFLKTGVMPDRLNRKLMNYHHMKFAFSKK